MYQTNVTPQSIQSAMQEVRNNFFLANDVIDRMAVSVSMNALAPMTGNLILFGPGGYGKTEMAEMFLTVATGKRPFVVNMNSATSPNEIFGGLNLEKFRNGEGVQYLIENSFMEHEWVIFEEGLEPRPKSLSALKYLMTSLRFVPPGQKEIAVKTRGIIVVTNIDTEVFKADQDTAAFLERFPIEYRVSWDRATAADKVSAIHKVIQKFDPIGNVQPNQRTTIATYAFHNKLSPRMIGRIVQALNSVHQMTGGSGGISSNTFDRVGEMFGWNLTDNGKLSEEMKDKICKENAEKTRAALSEIIKNVRNSINTYNRIKDHLDDPRYVIKLADEIALQIQIARGINDKSVNLRLNPEFGKYADELASWTAAEAGKLLDDIDPIRAESWDGLLNTIRKMIKLCEDNNINPDVTNVELPY